MPSKLNVKRVVVIGAGPAGAIAVEALARENKFSTIRVFERGEKAGGLWVSDPNHTSKISSLKDVLQRTVDRAVSVPAELPAYTRKDTIANSLERRYSYTLHDIPEMDIDPRIMSYTKKPFPSTPSTASALKNNLDSPDEHREAIRGWIEGLFDRRDYNNLVSYNTTVEKAEKIGEAWILTLRETGKEEDYWWQESFDAVVIASGHHSVPFIPLIPGLLELEERYPGTVEHSKSYRGAETYRDKKVIVVGSTITAIDIARDLINTAQTPITTAVGSPHPMFGFKAFEHPLIHVKPNITRITVIEKGSRIHFADGTSLCNPDHIIFGTGYLFSHPFLPPHLSALDNRRLRGLYEHIWLQGDPTLCFIGAISAGFNFRVFEYQAVAIARVLSNRTSLPSLSQQRAWENKRLLFKGNGVQYYRITPDFKDYCEELRDIAGPAGEGGRELVKWEPEWTKSFEEMVDNRLKLWEREGKRAEQKLWEGKKKIKAKL